MPYRLERFKIEHLDNFDHRPEQEADLNWFLKNTDVQRFWLRILPIFTFFYEDKPIMIFGIQNSGIGTYYPMLFAGRNIDKHRFAVVRCIYDYVEQFVDTDVRRFEAYVSATDTQAKRLVQFFGFEPVGIRRQAGVGGEDQVIFERLWRK